MDILTREDVQLLAGVEAEPCISLYMPTFRFESGQEQNPIRFKNLMKIITSNLEDMGHDEETITAMLAPAHALLDDTAFWRTVSDGLALFLENGEMQVFRLPIDFEELAVTGGKFHLKPLFPLIATNNRFYVLSLSQNQVRLYQGTHYAVSEVESKEIPESIAEALAFDDPQDFLQSHTTNRVGARSDVAHHGHGGDADDRTGQPQSDLKRFFDQIDDGVRRVLGDENAPLVLAGVKYYLPIYRDANTYPHLIDDEIAAGNPEHLHAKELHQKVWTIVEPLFMELQESSIDQFHHQYHNGGGLASDDLKAIVPASCFSQVDTLFVPIGEHRWGTYDAESNTVETHAEQQAGDDDLLNLATLHTYLNGGTVHALRPGNMPVEAPLAATFRYVADVAAEER